MSDSEPAIISYGTATFTLDCAPEFLRNISKDFDKGHPNNGKSLTGYYLRWIADKLETK